MRPRFVPMNHDLDNFVRTLTRAAELKRVKRAGWMRCGIGAASCESVADHTFGVALLALLLPPRVAGLAIDRDRCVRLALVHDLAEAIVGDITPHDGIDPAEKRRREERAIRELAATLGGDDGELLALWLEFEAGATPEARLVRELDVIEMAMQARAYERAGTLAAADAGQFIASARQRVTSEAGRALLAAVTDVPERRPRD